MSIQQFFRKQDSREDTPSTPASDCSSEVKSESGIGQTITIQDVRIDFPVKPYAAQIQMMNNIINVLNKGENALLESPTGSGKSLALLCAVLAWREKQEQIAAAEIKKKKTPQPKPETSQPIIKKQVKTRVEVVQNDIDDDFQQPIAKRFIGELVETEIEEKAELATLDEVKRLKYDTYKEVPRIFIGSRTHKQIAQLVSELKNKTRYRPRTTVLASRDHLCIHSKVKDSFKKAEDCTELLEKDKCMYAKRTQKILSHPSLKTTNRVWDIEDMISLGKVTKGCPYYAARKLYEGAEVIFCPYNYIIDPVIRKILDINLKESIIILDEAHNIEDASRSAGSYEIDENALDGLVKELGAVVKYGGEPDAHKKLELVTSQLYDLMTSDSTIYTSKEYEKQSCHFTGQELLNKLRSINISKNTYHEELLPCYKKASAHADFIRKELESNAIDRTNTGNLELENHDGTVRVKRVQCVSNGNLTLLQGIFLVLGFLCDPDEDYSKDYEMVLMKTIDRGNGAPANKRRKTTNQQTSRSLWTHKLAFWCLNPGIIFKNMCETTHSVILASGTLSPLNTFASELETKFTGQLEANHVIKPSQVLVNAVPFGPNRVALKGIYSNIESLQYQDEVGEALCDIVETVPYGVLCFMPSYKALDIMLERWKLTGVMERIEQKKLVFSEPRGKDKSEFENMLNRYYEKIRLVECGIDLEGQDGALLFAVFRGKVSEGIDFPDNNCRAVVTLGIPYPGLKDLEVTLKRDYNNRLKNQKKNVLSGNEWYSAQAFRAINQALGRCIRHKNDWGAIILLEERFTRQENANGLSKWVKNRLKVEYDYKNAISGLVEFVKTQQNEMDKVKMETQLLEEQKAEPIDIEQLPEIINLDDSFAEDKKISSQDSLNFGLSPDLKSIHLDSQDDQDIGLDPVLKSIENDLFAKPLPFETKKTMPILDPIRTSSPSLALPPGYAKLSCSSCQKELLRGPTDLMKPKTMDRFTCITDELDIPLVVQLEHPGVWETSNALMGGPLDLEEFPVNSNVIYNREDGICYKKLACSCNKERMIGIMVCVAASILTQDYVGNVYLFEPRVHKDVRLMLSQEDVENEIPNSQYCSSDDIFFNL